LDPDPYWIRFRIGIQPKMLDPNPDQDEMSADPQPCYNVFGSVYIFCVNPRPNFLKPDLIPVLHFTGIMNRIRWQERFTKKKSNYPKLGTGITVPYRHYEEPSFERELSKLNQYGKKFKIEVT
jgi:hypothetical protein